MIDCENNHDKEDICMHESLPMVQYRIQHSPDVVQQVEGITVSPSSNPDDNKSLHSFQDEDAEYKVVPTTPLRMLPPKCILYCSWTSQKPIAFTCSGQLIIATNIIAASGDGDTAAIAANPLWVVKT
ncbi:hypothetical protein ACH5RR_030127 [Cinchona calisaya]|uniref:Uncharacterized protein n=1 Tax=Cinchona calisaya TaxID=153742 RepID=A0ABD2YTN7_9GENT